MAYEVPTLEKLVKQAANLRKVYAKMSYPHLQDYHFSPCELDILILLANNTTIHTAKELVTYLGVAKSLVARSVDSLIQRAFLRVELDVHDRRIQHLYITREADEIIAIIRSNQAAFSKEILQGITDEELCITQNVMNQINENMNVLLEGVKKE